MTNSNVLFLCADQHARSALGCYGHSLIKTPNLDALAERGTLFTAGYTNSPVCVPARASMATGLHLYQHENWSSAEPYTGARTSWGHRVMAAGGRAASAGKLHYRDTTDANGFEPELVPMHMGKGWTTALLRKDTPALASNPDYAGQVGFGESEYTRYDRTTAKAASDWLREQASQTVEQPWALFVSFVSPHNPLTAPCEFDDWYSIDDIELPTGYDEQPVHHPVVAGIERCFNYDDYFTDEQHVREARRAYYALCSFVDQQVGRVLDALDETGQLDDTIIIYTADHGDMMGHRHLWGKSVMYEDSAGVPFILAGPGVPRAEVNPTPVSHVDCFPTIVEASGVGAIDEDQALPGESLLSLASQSWPERLVLSEYHDGGAATGLFMVRCGQYKYIEYPGFEPELFDLKSDPLEVSDLSDDPTYVSVREQCHHALGSLVDTGSVNQRVLEVQAALLERLGGRDTVLADGDRYAEYSYTPAPTLD